ncbi:Transposase [Anaerobranca gottschalkii DSM 13577]|uniref:Transposase n=1 Tax=Anaerobranca gottschalkii DSM 13577 TaxID=1120990 RepID=A0A1I0CRL7_9FIRM|nr:Transposase [Anaerobranca gottschalkii DSM 13577]
MVLDILDQRNFDFLVKYFKKFTSRESVKYVVIDMWKPYKEVVKKVFSQATIVIDRFHYVRNCIWAIDKVRKNVQKDLPYEKSKFLKKNRKLLFRNCNKLNDEDKNKTG